MEEKAGRFLCDLQGWKRQIKEDKIMDKLHHLDKQWGEKEHSCAGEKPGAVGNVLIGITPSIFSQL